jgi:hypothetical protein
LENTKPRSAGEYTRRIPRMDPLVALDRKRKLYAQTPEEVWVIIKSLQALKTSGQTDEQIESTIHEMDLPLRFHMYILANYSSLMQAKIR